VDVAYWALGLVCLVQFPVPENNCLDSTHGFNFSIRLAGVSRRSHFHAIKATPNWRLSTSYFSAHLSPGWAKAVKVAREDWRDCESLMLKPLRSRRDTVISATAWQEEEARIPTKHGPVIPIVNMNVPRIPESEFWLPKRLSFMSWFLPRRQTPKTHDCAIVSMPILFLHAHLVILLPS